VLADDLAIRDDHDPRRISAQAHRPARITALDAVPIALKGHQRRA